MKKIVDFLASAKLAITLFFILALFSIFGTLLPQGQPAQFYLMKYGKTLGNFILLLHLNNAYYSWWYVATLFLFLINLTICSLKRLPISLKLFKWDPSEIDPEKLPNKMSLKLNKDVTRITAFILDVLNFKKVEKEIKEGYLFFRDFNRWSYLSVYIVHLSLVFILLGGLIGVIWGFKGNLVLIEGETSNQIMPFGKKEPIFLDFYLKLNKFTIELYPNGMPKEYISNVTVIDKNKKIDALIKVNHPLQYKNITFYQASYDEVPQFIISIEKNGKKEIKTLDSMLPLNIDNKYDIFLETYMRHQGGFLVAKIRIVNEDTGEQQIGFLVEGKPLTVNFGNEKITLNMEGVKPLYMSILQVKKDPGVVLVYLGFICMILGLLAVYFFEPKTFWIYVKPDNKGVLINLGAKAKRERDTLILKLQDLAKKLEKEA